MDEEQQDYLNSEINRFSEEEVNRIKSMRDEDDMMLEIIENLTIQKLFLIRVDIIHSYILQKHPELNTTDFL